MAKSPDAFRTISEVAEWLGVQAHVLRFWESKFSQVKPIKRAGGRRYYRPNDMLLLGGIRRLLHEDGLTIKGVQKLLRENGVAHVAAMSQPLDEHTETEAQDTSSSDAIDTVEGSVVVQLDAAPIQESNEAEEELTGAADAIEELEEVEAADLSPVTDPITPEEQDEVQPELSFGSQRAEKIEPEPEPEEAPAPSAVDEAEDTFEVSESVTADESLPNEGEVDDFSSVSEPVAEPAAEAEASVETESEDEPPAAAALPAFLRRPMVEPDDKEEQVASTVPAEPERKPRIIEMPVITPIDEIPARPTSVSKVGRLRHLSEAQAAEIAPLLKRLSALRDAMQDGGANGAQSRSDT